MPESPEQFLQTTGNYRALHAYRKAEVIYDFTLRFCETSLTAWDRTRDQMIQAARSGKQDIAEGSKASVTSTETEVKLMNVARASLVELLLDCQDFLRVRDFPLWAKNSKEPLYIRKLGSRSDESFESYRPFMETSLAAVLANVAMCLIHQANYLLDQLVRRLERDFVEKGGLRERMTRARLNHRESRAQRSR